MTTNVPPGLLQSLYPLSTLAALFAKPQDWHPYPTCREREPWNRLLAHPFIQARRDWLLDQAEKSLAEPWPQLPATLYLEYTRTGNRSHYEAAYFERRYRLGLFALAECFSASGRFLNPALDALWSICEEATWCLPAHNFKHNGGPEKPDGLPRPDRPAVDLFAAETAAVVAESFYLLAPSLQTVSAQIAPRIRDQVLSRVVAPAEQHDDFGWLSGYNNWTPWICQNVLQAAFYCLEDPARLVALIDKLLAANDRFIARYGDAGGCDEGPTYWGVAAGALFLFLELLYQRSGGAINVFDHPKIRAMGRYISTVHLADPWFSAFADAVPRLHVSVPMTWRYGERIHAPEMVHLAAASARDYRPDGPVSPALSRTKNHLGSFLNNAMHELFWLPPDLTPPAEPLPSAPDHGWLPDIQVVTARRPGAPFILSAKGGHNAESHNHNDIGQFILLCQGEPVIVDVGCETYTAQTFSHRRYELWFTRAASHNVPIINGIEQTQGAEHRARNVSCTLAPEQVTFSLDLAPAYPASLGLRSLRRQLIWTPAAVTVTDSIEGSSGPLEMILPLYTPAQPELRAPGELVFNTPSGKCQLRFPATFSCELTLIPITDPRMAVSFHPHLHRIHLAAKSPTSRLDYTLTFTPG